MNFLISKRISTVYKHLNKFSRHPTCIITGGRKGAFVYMFPEIEIDEYVNGCADDAPHAPYHAFIRTLYDDTGAATIDEYELICKRCGEDLDTFEMPVNINEEKK
jgi:hypothetical protein